MDNHTCSYLIMMAVYNGEQYLKEQLDSILNQSVTNWTLIIQDDGSSDTTCAIIEQYAAKDHRIRLLHNETNNHGPYQNYNILYNKCRKMDPYDFYLFCDQDDIWDSDKISKLTAFYDGLGSQATTPVLVNGDMRIINEKDEVVHESLNQLDKIERKNQSVYFDASVWGCNFFFNRALFMDIVEVPDLSVRVWGHDQYLAKWAVIRGKFAFCSDVTMSYRRHSQNVTSDHQFDVNTSRILRRLNKINELAFDHAVGYKSSLFVLRQLKKKELSQTEAQNVKALEECINRGGLNALIYFISHKIDLGRKVRTISHLGILILGIYKKYLALSFDEE